MFLVETFLDMTLSTKRKKIKNMFLEFGCSRQNASVCTDLGLEFHFVSSSSILSHSQVRESVINRFLIAKHHFLLSDLVNEEEIPTLG